MDQKQELIASLANVLNGDKECRELKDKAYQMIKDGRIRLYDDEDASVHGHAFWIYGPYHGEDMTSINAADLSDPDELANDLIHESYHEIHHEGDGPGNAKTTADRCAPTKEG